MQLRWTRALIAGLVACNLAAAQPVLPGSDGSKTESAMSASATVDAAVEAILVSARTDKVGDGKIFVSEIVSAIRIRTGEIDDDAV